MDKRVNDDNVIRQSTLETKCCFDINLMYTDQQPKGFKDWTAQIKFEKCRLTLPDKSTVDVRLYLDMNNTIDSGSLTNFLLNRYNEQI